MPVARRLSRAEFERLWLVEEWGGQRVADHFGVDRSTITKWARAFGLPLRTERRKARWVIPPDQVADLVSMWRARVKMTEIARHFGCNNRTVENTVKRLGEGNRGKASAVTFLTLAQYREMELAHLLAKEAAITRAALRDAEMVDNHQAFSRLTRRAA